MSVRVWSPEVGVRILFKVEQVGNPGINVETFSFTTVAEAWETIVFDFANPMPNTNPINFENVYDKASIFFDFQCNLDPTATLPATFYWDDVAFGAPPPPGDGLAFDPNPLVATLATGETGTETVTVTNNSDQEVAYDFSQYSGTPPPARAQPTSGRAHPRARQGRGRPPRLRPALRRRRPRRLRLRVDRLQRARRPRLRDDRHLGDRHRDRRRRPQLDELLGRDRERLRRRLRRTRPPVRLLVLRRGLRLGERQRQRVAHVRAAHRRSSTASRTTPCRRPTSPTAGLIAPLWDDFEIGGEGPEGGQIFYQTLADGRFVVQFDNVQKFANDTENNTFQVILSPAGTIKYQYVDLQSTAFSYSIGIENLDGTDGLEVAMGSTYAENGLAVLISAAPGFVTAVSPATGTIPAGGSVDVDVTFDASGLIGGVYEGSLTVETDLDADPNVFELDVQLNVEGMAACMITAADLEFDDTIVGNASSEDATVTNGGTDACALTGASASGPFSVEGFSPVTLAPGASTTFSVVFEPTAAGAASGTLTVTQDGGGDLTAGLSGLGQDEPTPAVDPASLTFNVPVGGTELAGAHALERRGR